MADFDPTRRKFNIGVGTALGITLAGCMGGGDDDSSENGDDNGEDNGGDNGDDNGDDNGGDNGDDNGGDNGDDNGGNDGSFTVIVVSDPDWNPPIEGATVLVDGEEVGQTDDTGEVALDLEPGEYEIEAQALRHYNTSEQVTVDEDGGEFEITLERVETDGQASLGLGFENENDDTVEIGMDVTFAHSDGYDVVERSYVGQFDETDHFGGDMEYKAARMRVEPEVLNPLSLTYAGEWELTVEPNEENDFEPYQETIEYTEEDLENEAVKTRSIVLEGAMSETERWQEEALVLDGEQHHIDGNHDPETDWALTGHGEEENVDQQEWNGDDNQLWNFELVGDEDQKWHRIVNEESELVWDATYNRDEEDADAWTEVKTAEWDESDNQLWRIRPVHPEDPGVEEGDELYRIEGKVHASAEKFDHGAAAGPEGGTMQPDTRVITWWYAAGGDQQLFLSPHE